MYPIEPVERVAVTFLPADIVFPEVVSLRENFPQVPHLNLRDRDQPKSVRNSSTLALQERILIEQAAVILCISDEGF